MHSNERMHYMTDDTLDSILREELRWQVPPNLTNQLLLLVSATSPLYQPSPAGGLYVRSSPRTWYSVLVMVLTSISVGLSFALAWQVYGVVGAELGLVDLWLQMHTAVSSAFHWLFNEFPMIQKLVPLFMSTYEQVSWVLNWLLVSMIVWLALDGSTPGTPLHQHQTS